jgi:hypothetical protein
MLQGVFQAVVLVNGALLAFGAASKLRNPVPFSSALAQMLRFSSHTVVRLIALGEMAVAALPLLVGWIGCVVLAVGDLVMVAALLRLRRVAPGASCGCFGASVASISHLHIALNACFAAAAIGAIVDDVDIATMPASTSTSVLWLMALAVLCRVIYELFVMAPTSLQPVRTHSARKRVR